LLVSGPPLSENRSLSVFLNAPLKGSYGGSSDLKLHCHVLLVTHNILKIFSFSAGWPYVIQTIIEPKNYFSQLFFFVLSVRNPELLTLNLITTRTSSPCIQMTQRTTQSTSAQPCFLLPDLTRTPSAAVPPTFPPWFFLILHLF